MNPSSIPVPTCATCEKPQDTFPQPLKRCARCSITLYCSRECQKVDWKNHRRACNSQESTQQNSAPFPSTGQHNPGFDSANQMLGLANNDHLHKLTERHAFEQLIDCFRMRMEDEYVFGANNIGIYAEEDPRPEFKQFLDLAETRRGILPPWWNAEKRRECERIAMEHGGWSDINCAVEKSDIQEHYGKGIMPMKLRILGEKIYGRGFM